MIEGLTGLSASLTASLADLGLQSPSNPSLGPRNSATGDVGKTFATSLCAALDADVLPLSLTSDLHLAVPTRLPGEVSPRSKFDSQPIQILLVRCLTSADPSFD